MKRPPPQSEAEIENKSSTKPSEESGWFKFPHDVDIATIKPSHLKMFVILERCCPYTSYCWHSNRTLAKKYGCCVRQVTNILDEMQAAGHLWRLLVNPDGFRRRAGIFLHKRLDPDRPVEDKPPPPEAMQRLWAARNRRRTAPHREDAPHREEKFPRVQEEKFPRVQEEKFPPSKKESLSLNKTDCEGPGGSLDRRQRKDNPTRPAGPVVITPGIPAPAAAELPRAEALTPGQLGFLMRLDADQRSLLDALTPGKRADLLKPHEKGFVADILDFQIRTELKAVRPIEALPSIPATMAELLEQLPGKPRAWASQAAELLAQDLEDRRYWGEFHKITEEIRAGTIDPAPAINAYHQAMKPKIAKRGAKFWAAFKGLTGLNACDLKEMAASL